MKLTAGQGISRRNCLAIGAGSALGLSAQAQRPAIRRLGIFSLLGNSVRIVAREIREGLFKEVGMDDVAFDAAGRALQARRPQVELRHFRAPAEVDVESQLKVGLAAARRAELPKWMFESARETDLSHVLLITSNSGVRHFRTAGSEVVDDDRVTGIGFVVSGAGRTKDSSTGAVTSGYLAPFVQLRLTLIDLTGPRAVHSATLGEGYIVGAPVSEAPDPWRFLSHPEKATALAQLLRQVITRGMQEVLDAT